MYQYIVAIAFTGFNALVLSIIVASNPAKAQDSFNFVDLNQSRQFFDEGNELLEREIKWLQQDEKLPQIKLPQDLPQSQNMQDSYSVYGKAKLKPISKRMSEK